MSKITINVDTLDINVSEGLTILEAIREADYDQFDMSIPTLYYLKGVKEVDDSGVCVAEVEGEAELVNASSYKVYEGMKILTKSPSCMEARKAVLANMAAHHDKDCINCHRPGTCELQELLHKYEIVSDKMAADKKEPVEAEGIILRDHNKCIHLQISSADVWSHSKVLLCRKTWHCKRKHRYGQCHALFCEKS